MVPILNYDWFSHLSSLDPTTPPHATNSPILLCNKMLFTLNPEGKKLFYYLLGILLAFNIYFLLHAISPEYNLSTCTIKFAIATKNFSYSLYTQTLLSFSMLYTALRDIPLICSNLFKEAPVVSSGVGGSVGGVDVDGGSSKPVSLKEIVPNPESEKKKKKKNEKQQEKGNDYVPPEEVTKPTSSSRHESKVENESMIRRKEKSFTPMLISAFQRLVIKDDVSPPPPSAPSKQNLFSSSFSYSPFIISLIALYRLVMITFYRKYFKLTTRNFSLFIILSIFSISYCISVYHLQEIFVLIEENCLRMSAFLFCLFISFITILLGIPKNSYLSTFVHPYITIDVHEERSKFLLEERRRIEREKKERIKRQEIKMQGLKIQEEQEERMAVKALKSSGGIGSDGGSSSAAYAGQSPLPLDNWGVPQSLKAVALHSYRAKDGKSEISLEKGKIYHISDCRGNWWRAKDDDSGFSGYVPSNYLLCDQRGKILKDFTASSTEDGSIKEVKEGDLVEVLEVHDDLIIVRAVVASLNQKRIGSIPREYINLL